MRSIRTEKRKHLTGVFMRKAALLLFFVFTTHLFSEERVFHDMKQHRQASLAEIKSNPQNVDPYYPLWRVSRTINADDTDYIPKVPDAGKIFEENGVRY